MGVPAVCPRMGYGLLINPVPSPSAATLPLRTVGGEHL